MLIRRLISVSLLYYFGVSQVYGHAAKDYAQSFTDSRVKGLVKFFELVQKSSENVAVSQNTNVVLSLSESASKLYTLIHGQTLDHKCDKYIKLLSRPNIRTVATISVLMKESQSFGEISQRDSNLMAKLISEREFDALARIQTILQTLEMETVLGKSSLAPNVEKDLLDCVSYYIYRHQRAATDIIKHVRASLNKLPKSLVASDKQEMTLRTIAKAVDKARTLETTQGHFQLEEWLTELDTIHQLTLANDFELPERVQDFLTDPKRIKRLHLIDKGEELKAHLLDFESSSNPTDNDLKKYVRTLKSLQDVCQEFTEIIPEATCALMKDPKRQRLIGSQLKKEPKESSELTGTAKKALSAPREAVATTVRESVPINDLVFTGDHDVFSHGVPSRLEKSDRSVSAMDMLQGASPALEAPISADLERRVNLKSSHRHRPETPGKRESNVAKKKERRRGAKSKDHSERAAQKIFLPKGCMVLLNKIQMFFDNYIGVNTSSSEMRRGASKLRQFRYECMGDKEAEHNLLKSRLNSWCRSNPFLSTKKECKSVMALLEQLGDEEEEHI